MKENRANKQSRNKETIIAANTIFFRLDLFPFFFIYTRFFFHCRRRARRGGDK